MQTDLNRLTAETFFKMFNYKEYTDEKLAYMAGCSVKEIMTWRLEYGLFRPKEGPYSLKAEIIYFDKENI